MGLVRPRRNAASGEEFSPFDLSAQSIQDLNRVAAFLAVSDFPSPVLSSATMRTALGTPVADVVALMGSSVLATAEEAFSVLRRELALRLLISGGIGHSTPYLYESMASHPVYSAIATGNRTEADLLAEIATRFWDINPQLILVERESRHCGENAAFTMRTLLESGEPMGTVLLMQDPTMQRRTAATFAKTCADQRLTVTIASHPTFVPQVARRGDGLAFEVSPYRQRIAGLWSIRRFVGLVLGEIPRLRDDGYGPAGKHFLEHVDSPPSVLAAHNRLAERFPALQR